MKTIGELLPKKQSKLLTKKVANMTRKELEKEVNDHPKSDLSYKDIKSLRKLAVMRVNKGLSMYTFEKHDFHEGDDEQDPNTCFCL